MRSFVFILLAVLCFVFVSCAGVPYVRYDPQAVTDNAVGSKIGTAPCSATGIQEAANSAGITRIATVDIKEESDGKIVTRMYVVSGE
jgi:hypothetical protein